MKRFRAPLVAAVTLTVALGAFPRAVLAEDPPARPQANAGIQVGLARVATEGDDTRTLLDLGLHGDVLFGRNSPHAWGFGPAAGIGTYRFKDLELEAGASLLIPVHEYLPFVLTAGPYARKSSVWDPGAFASLFWGTRSFNYEGSYGLVGGIVVEGRYGLGDPKERTIVIALHLDLEVILLPVVMAINAAR